MYDLGRDIVAFFADMPCLMLIESFFGRLAGHAHIETLQHPVELRVGCPKARVLCKYSFGELHYIDPVFSLWHGLYLNDKYAVVRRQRRSKMEPQTHQRRVARRNRPS